MYNRAVFQVIDPERIIVSLYMEPVSCVHRSQVSVFIGIECIYIQVKDGFRIGQFPRSFVTQPEIAVIQRAVKS